MTTRAKRVTLKEQLSEAVRKNLGRSLDLRSPAAFQSFLGQHQKTTAVRKLKEGLDKPVSKGIVGDRALSLSSEFLRAWNTDDSKPLTPKSLDVGGAEKVSSSLTMTPTGRTVKKSSVAGSLLARVSPSTSSANPSKVLPTETPNSIVAKQSSKAPGKTHPNVGMCKKGARVPVKGKRPVGRPPKGGKEMKTVEKVGERPLPPPKTPVPPPKLDLKPPTPLRTPPEYASPVPKRPDQPPAHKSPEDVLANLTSPPPAPEKRKSPTPLRSLSYLDDPPESDEGQKDPITAPAATKIDQPVAKHPPAKESASTKAASPKVAPLKLQISKKPLEEAMKKEPLSKPHDQVVAKSDTFSPLPQQPQKMESPVSSGSGSSPKLAPWTKPEKAVPAKAASPTAAPQTLNLKAATTSTSKLGKRPKIVKTSEPAPSKLLETAMAQKNSAPPGARKPVSPVASNTTLGPKRSQLINPPPPTPSATPPPKFQLKELKRKLKLCKGVPKFEKPRKEPVILPESGPERVTTSTQSDPVEPPHQDGPSILDLVRFPLESVDVVTVDVRDEVLGTVANLALRMHGLQPLRHPLTWWSLSQSGEGSRRLLYLVLRSTELAVLDTTEASVWLSTAPLLLRAVLLGYNPDGTAAKPHDDLILLRKKRDPIRSLDILFGLDASGKQAAAEDLCSLVGRASGAGRREQLSVFLRTSALLGHVSACLLPTLCKEGSACVSLGRAVERHSVCGGECGGCAELRLMAKWHSRQCSTRNCARWCRRERLVLAQSRKAPTS